MSKILLQITGIILVNLFAFLTVGHILDAIFKTEGIWLMVSVLVSIPVLALILSQKSKYFLQQLQDTSKPDGK